MYTTLRTLLTIVTTKMESPSDTIKSIGTWCGNSRASYTIYVRRQDGTEYEINI